MKKLSLTDRKVFPVVVLPAYQASLLLKHLNGLFLTKAELEQVESIKANIRKQVPA